MQKSVELFLPSSKVILQMSIGSFGAITPGIQNSIPTPSFLGSLTQSTPLEIYLCAFPTTTLVHSFSTFGNQFPGISSEIHFQRALCILAVMRQLHSQTRHILWELGQGRGSLRLPCANRHVWWANSTKMLWSYDIKAYHIIQQAVRRQMLVKQQELRERLASQIVELIQKDLLSCITSSTPRNHAQVSRTPSPC